MAVAISADEIEVALERLCTLGILGGYRRTNSRRRTWALILAGAGGDVVIWEIGRVQAFIHGAESAVLTLRPQGV